MIAVLPLLLYPGMGIGMVQMSVLFSEQPRTVAILGSENRPGAPPAATRPVRFAMVQDFLNPAMAEKLEVVTDAKAESQKQGSDGARAMSELKTNSQELWGLVAEHDRLSRDKESAEKAHDTAVAHKLSRQLEPVHERLGALLEKSGVEIVILVPEGFAAELERVDRELASRQPGTGDRGTELHPFLIHNGAEEKSLMAYQAVRGSRPGAAKLSNAS
jgi:sodium transport system permease protein